MNAVSDKVSVILSGLIVLAQSVLAADPVVLLGRPFRQEAIMALWPSNSVIQTQRRIFRPPPVAAGKSLYAGTPLWTHEAYLVDRQGVDDNSIWHQNPVVEYGISSNPSKNNETLMRVCFYMNAKTPEAVHHFLEKYWIETPLFTNMCLRFPNQVWTGIDGMTFQEDRTLGINAMPHGRVLYRYDNGELNYIAVVLPLEESGAYRPADGISHIPPRSLIDLPLLRQAGAIHVLGERTVTDRDKGNTQSERVQKMRDGNRAKTGEKIFECLRGLGVFPVVYISDGCSRPPENKGIYASRSMDIIVETFISGFLDLEFDSINCLFINLKKTGKDCAIKISKEHFLEKTEAGCKLTMESVFESKRFDGLYKLCFFKDGVTLLIDKEGAVCMLGVSMHESAMDERFIRRMLQYYEMETIRDLEIW